MVTNHRLESLNDKIIIYNRLITKLPFGIGFKIFKTKYNKLVIERDQCFRDLRDSIRETHPELFIGGNY